MSRQYDLKIFQLEQTHLATVTLTTASRETGIQFSSYGRSRGHHLANIRVTWRVTLSAPALSPVQSDKHLSSHTVHNISCSITHACRQTTPHQYQTKLKTKAQLSASSGMRLWPVSVCLSLCLSRLSKAASLLLSSGGLDIHCQLPAPRTSYRSISATECRAGGVNAVIRGMRVDADLWQAKQKFIVATTKQVVPRRLR